jgi:ABC-type transporter Mla MlaB component
MLKITIHDSAGECRFRLEGRLAGAWVQELAMSWETAASTMSGRAAVIDLRDVDFVDAEGEALLIRLHMGRARLEAETPLMRDLIQRITGELPAAAPAQRRAKCNRHIAKLISHLNLFP